MITTVVCAKETWEFCFCFFLLASLAHHLGHLPDLASSNLVNFPEMDNEFCTSEVLQCIYRSDLKIREGAWEDGSKQENDFDALGSVVLFGHTSYLTD